MAQTGLQGLDTAGHSADGAGFVAEKVIGVLCGLAGALPSP
jgi:hypothetical protein